MPTRTHDAKLEAAKREHSMHPGKDDVHEQREPEQPREGVVTPRAPSAGKTGPSRRSRTRART